MGEPQLSDKSWGCVHWGVVIVVGAIGLAYLLPARHMISDMAVQTSASNNARQLIMAMKIYANDHDTVYPDSKHPEFVTSNQAFRRLFQEDILQDERICGGKVSPFMPDGKIGKAPDFKEAVNPGENHWALVAKQSTKEPGYHPLIFENGIDANWPPRWKLDSTEKLVRGRVWKRNKIIIGRNDNSVNVEQMVKSGGLITLPKTLLKSGGGSWPEEFKILDIEEGRVERVPSWNPLR